MKVEYIKALQNLKDGKRIYTCSVCGTVFNWSKESWYFGSLSDVENNPNNIVYMCSNKCKRIFNRRDNKDK